MEIRFRPIRTQLSEPLSADKNQWFKNVYWLFLTNICNFASPTERTSIFALGVLLTSIYAKYKTYLQDAKIVPVWEETLPAGCCITDDMKLFVGN